MWGCTALIIWNKRATGYMTYYEVIDILNCFPSDSQWVQYRAKSWLIGWYIVEVIYCLMIWKDDHIQWTWEGAGMEAYEYWNWAKQTDMSVYLVFHMRFEQDAFWIRVRNITTKSKLLGNRGDGRIMLRWK